MTASTAPRWPVRYLLFIGGLGGLLYGIDIGIIAGALPYLEQPRSAATKTFTLDARRKDMPRRTRRGPKALCRDSLILYRLAATELETAPPGCFGERPLL